MVRFVPEQAVVASVRDYVIDNSRGLEAAVPFTDGAQRMVLDELVPIFSPGPPVAARVAVAASGIGEPTAFLAVLFTATATRHEHLADGAGGWGLAWHGLMMPSPTF